MWLKILRLPVWALLLIVLAGVIIIALVFSSLNPLNPLNFIGQPPTKVDTSQTAVVRQIQSLNRLETAQYTIDKVITAGTDGNAFQNLLYGDRILLVAHGTVTAGVDLSGVSKDDIKVDGSTLNISLPDTQIFSTDLDENQTKVFSRTEGLLSKGNKDLESQARSAAVGQIAQAACTDGILKQAASEAQSRLAEMYKLVGFETVNVTVIPGKC